MYICYQVIACALFVLIFPMFLLYSLMTGRHWERLGQRLGSYPGLAPKEKCRPRIWLHAASLGEVQAAKAVIVEIRALSPQVEIVLSTMTAHGYLHAVTSIGGNAVLVLAPLDVPFVVDRAITAIDPDLYVCIETELWPLLLKKMAGRDRPLLLINGRMSSGSFRCYRQVGPFMRDVLAQFTEAAMITRADWQRYIDLGLDPKRGRVLGNVKYDLVLPRDPGAVRARSKAILRSVIGGQVIIAGSTHEGEEELLLALLDDDQAPPGRLLVVAPRHPRRIPQLMKMLAGRGQDFDLYSALCGGRTRGSNLVLVDTMGQLADLYSAADFVFCGGSLVPKGGHNIMEVALWGLPVFYGPHMDDFNDATRMLEEAGAGFMVPDVRYLSERIAHYQGHPEMYRLACVSAQELILSQQGAALQSARLVLSVLHKREEGMANTVVTDTRCRTGAVNETP